MKPRITEFTEGSNGAWYWTVEYDGVPGIDHFDRVERHYHTNRDGEGLWRGDRQILGTCQFSLPADRKRARAKVYRLFVRERDDTGIWTGGQG